jgi:hypothetical protein
VQAAAEVSRGRDIAQWERWRDEKLASLLELLGTPPTYEEPR